MFDYSYSGYAGYTTDVKSALARLSDSACIDLCGLNAIHGLQNQMMASHRAALVAHGYDDVKFITYEGGWEAVYDDKGVWNTGQERIDAMARAAGLVNHPKFFQVEMARHQHNQDNWPLTLETRYTLDSTGDPGQGYQWHNFVWYGQDVGTGDPSENVNPYDLRPRSTTPVVSQWGGAQRLWASQSIARGSGDSAFTFTKTTAPAAASMSLHTTGAATRLTFSATTADSLGMLRLRGRARRQSGTPGPRRGATHAPAPSLRPTSSPNSQSPPIPGKV
jgi:hypothetical protein